MIIILSTGQVPSISLTRVTPTDVINGGVVCPNLYPVEFTCVGVEVSFLEWRRNEISIGVFTGNFNDGDILQPEGPLVLFLDSITRRGDRATITSRLVGNISNLINGDRIRCIELGDREDTGTLDYMTRGDWGSVYTSCSQ